MVEIKEKLNLDNITRNYDKDPIIIEDYNSLFMFFIMISMIPLMIYTYIYNPGGTSEGSLFRNIFIILPVGMYPYVSAYLKSRGKRKILLGNKSIKFMHENIVIEEILISEITDIKKTYSDIYNKSQSPSELILLAMYILILFIVISQKAYYLLLIVPIFHILLVFVKYIFHKLKDDGYQYKFHDAVIVYSGERFINILPSTNKEYMAVKEYFLTKSLGDIQSKEIYFELMGHSFEKINLGE